MTNAGCSRVRVSFVGAIGAKPMGKIIVDISGTHSPVDMGMTSPRSPSGSRFANFGSWDANGCTPNAWSPD
jgi:hypothetical protein